MSSGEGKGNETQRKRDLMASEFEFWDQKWQSGNTPWTEREWDAFWKVLWSYGEEHMAGVDEVPQNVFVPLCGNTGALLWFHNDKQLEVVGVDLSETAILDMADRFGGRDGFTVQEGSERVFADGATVAVEGVESVDNAKVLDNGKGVQLVVDDILAYPVAQGQFGLVYDVGCFMALAPELRADFVKVVTQATARGGLWLQNAVVRSDDKGPPYAVHKDGDYEAAMRDYLGDAWEIVSNEPYQLDYETRWTYRIYVFRRL